MPFNEIEHHPYLDYLGANANYADYAAMIIGSFPIYPITASVPVEAAGHDKRQNWQQYARTQFFYGSNGNLFWERFHQSQNDLPIPDYVTANLTNLLNQNGFLITDALRSACRNEYSSSDRDLIPIEHNHDLLTALEQMDGDDIFFTSAPTGLNNPFSLFTRILIHNDMFVNGMFIPIHGTRNFTMNLFNRDFRVGFLFSPSPQGAINQNRVQEYLNYIQINPGATYRHFVMVQWKQLLFHRNFDFNGTNAI